MKIFDPYALGLDIVGRSGKELVVSCPFHDDSHPSAEYNFEKGLFYCFGCHTSKTAQELALELGGYLIKVSSSTILRIDNYEELAISKEWINLMRVPLAYGNPYLKERMVAEYQIDRHEIRANKQGIIFPLRNQWGELKGFQMRQLEKRPKYLFFGEKTPVFPMNRFMGWRKFLVVEGIFGALRAELFGVPAIATLGSSNVLEVSNILKGMSNKPFILMDHDAAGFLAAGKYALLGFDVIIPKETPPDEETPGGLMNSYAQAEQQSTRDVNKIIESSPDPFQLQRSLEKFWRKL